MLKHLDKRFAAVLAATLLIAGCLGGCSSPQGETSAAAVKGEELFCAAESLQQAEEIAALYEIELVDFGDGIATFHTEEDLNEVLARGEQNHYPELSVNSEMQLFD